MTSSDDSDASKSSKPASKKHEANSTNNSYLTLLNSNNKFNEMFKNKMKQTEISPVVNKFKFNPVASSTQIGTPDELKHNPLIKKKAAPTLQFKSKTQTSTDTSSNSEAESSKVVKEESISDSDTAQINVKTKYSKRTKNSLQPKIIKKESLSSPDSESNVTDFINEWKSNIQDNSNKFSKFKKEERKKILKHKVQTKNKSSSESETNSLSSQTKRKHVSSSSDDSSNKSPQNQRPAVSQILKKSKVNQKVTSELSLKGDYHLPVKPKNVGTKLNSESTSSDEHVSSNNYAKSKTENSKSSLKRTLPNTEVNKIQSSTQIKHKSSSKPEKCRPPIQKHAKRVRNTQSSSESSSESENNVDSLFSQSKDIVTETTSQTSKQRSSSSNLKAVPRKSSSSTNENSSTLKLDQEKVIDAFITKEGKIRKRKRESLSDDNENRPHIMPVTSTSPSDRLYKLENENSLKIIRNPNVLKIKSKEHAFIIQVPIKLDPQKLLGANISLEDLTHINKKYDSIPSYEPQEALAIFTNTENPQIIKPVGMIKFQRHLKTQKIPNIPDSLNKPLLFPSNLKNRHPLFGSNFDNKINLDEHIQMKLKNAMELPTKKKKKKEKKHDVEKPPHEEEEIFKFLSQTASDTDVSADIKKVKKEISSPDERRHKKKKKKKNREYDHDKDEQIEDGNDSTNKKRKHLEMDDITIKKEDGFTDMLIQEMLSSKLATLDVKKKKKKKKRQVEESP